MLVTALICAYNYERWVGDAVRSALAQTHRDVEVVVVDDGSTDGTAEVLAGFGGDIRVIRQANGGLGAATSTGVRAARGDVIALLDADDTWSPHKLERQLERFARSEVGLVYTDMEVVDGDGRTLAPSYFAHHGMEPPAGRVLGSFLQRNWAPAPTLALRAGLARRWTPIPRVAWCQDWWFALRAAEVCELDVVREPLTRYRVHADNMSSAGDVGGERWLRVVQDDNLFRRWFLGHLDLSSAELSEIRAAWETFARYVGLVARERGVTGRDLIPVTTADRARATMLAAAAAAEPDDAEAARLLVQALAADPYDTDLVQRFNAAAGATAPAPAAAPAVRVVTGPSPRVSAIVCAHNYADYVGQALESALDQDFPPGELEVIVVDDGSTDATPDVIARFGDRVHAIRRPNGGLVAATHTGIAAARGEFLTFLDADDVWPRNRTRLLVDALDHHPEAGLVYGDMEVIDGAGRRLHPSFRQLAGIDSVEGHRYGQLLARNAVSAGAMMVRTSLKGRYHPPAAAAPLQQDWWIVCRVAEVAEVVAIDACVNRYRHHGSNMNLGAGDAQRRRLLAGELAFRRWLLERVQPGQASRDELVAALEAFDGLAAALTPDDGAPPLEPHGDAWLTAMEAASTALDVPDVEAAFAGLVRAAAAHPADAQSRSLLVELTAAAPVG